MRSIKSIEDLGRGIKIIDFWANWCSPCKSLIPILENIEKKHNVEILKFNIDDNPEIPVAMGIRSVPTLVIYKDGTEIDRIMGLVKEDVIAKKIESIL